MEGDTQQWDYSIFWKEALNQIRQHLSEQEYVMWFRNIQYYASRENEIILAVPSSFYRDQVTQRYLKLIQDTLFDLSGMSIQVTFEIVKLQPPANHSGQPSAGSEALQEHSSARGPVDNSGAGRVGGHSKAGPRPADSNSTLPSQNDSPQGQAAAKSKSSAGSGPNSAASGAPKTKAKKEHANPPGTVPGTSPGGFDEEGTNSAAAHGSSGRSLHSNAHNSNALSGAHNSLQGDPQHKPQSSQHHHPQLNLRKHSELRIDYSFENFVVGENNSFAANACIAISKNPGTAYNPCLIYGGVGLGKTHLIQSIGNFIHNNYEKTRVVYVTAETFTNEFIQSIRDGKNHQFKNRYRNVDVLLIDDIHFLQSKDQTQEELFHTFNALYDSNKQMVFTCDRPVSELKHLTDRLRSRFERGLNVDLQPPNYETRYAILKRKTEEKRAAIDEEVIELISKNITTNVRDLEAALTKLIAYSDILNKKITVDIAQEQLKDVFSSPKQSNITIEIIQRAVADYFNLSPYDLRGKKRTKAIAFPRQIAMYITREITEFSTTEVGLEFGGRDHTTVMHACQRIESRMQTDSYLEPNIQRLIRQIKEYGTK